MGESCEIFVFVLACPKKYSSRDACINRQSNTIIHALIFTGCLVIEADTDFVLL